MEDPTKITPSQERHVKKHVTEFFEKAVLRKKERDEKDAAKRKKEGLPSETPNVNVDVDAKQDEESDDEPRMDMSDDENEKPEPEMVTPITSATPVTPADQLVSGDRLKRKREGEEESNGVGANDAESTPKKQLRSETPPPPPPPPTEDSPGVATRQNLDSSRNTGLETPTEQSQAVGSGAVSPPQAPPVSSRMAYTPFNDTCAADDPEMPSMMFNGIDGTLSDNEEVEMEGVHGSMHELGIRRVPELQGQ